MKNSIFYAFKSLFVLLIALTFLTVTAFAPPGSKNEKSKTGFTVKVDKTVKGEVISTVIQLQIADLPKWQGLNITPHYSYIKPVNDAKPDNLHFQLVRSETLKLYKNARNC